jgi:hypothetical protein
MTIFLRRTTADRVTPASVWTWISDALALAMCGIGIPVLIWFFGVALGLDR